MDSDQIKNNISAETRVTRKHYSSRWGRFRISGHFIAEIKTLAGHGEWDRLEALMGFMAQVFVVRANDTPDHDSVEYWGISRHFEELAEGEYPPEYMIEFQRIQQDCPHCQGVGCCDHCEQGQVIVDHFKAVRRVQYRVMNIPGHISEEDLVNFKRKWNAMMTNQGWEIP